MVRSLAVVFVIVGLVLVATPRSKHEKVRVVEWQQTYAQAVATTDLPLYGPVGLPDRWRSTSARLTDPEGPGTVLWFVGFVTPRDRFAAVQQSDGDGPTFVRETTYEGRLDGTVTIGGAAWQRYVGSDNGDPVRSLVLPSSSSTVIVSGSASFEELQQLATALRAE